jgi:hypothetical protein
MRSAQNQANQTFNSATDNAATYGSNASAIGANLTPLLTQRLLNPSGYSQGDMGAMLANALGSAEGSTSGITGQANLQAARSRNDAGFSTALAEAARARTAAAAHASEGVATDNANLKQEQSNNAAKMLAGLYGTDVGAQNDALNTANNSIQTGIEAGKSGWLQNLTSLISAINGNGTGTAAAIARYCWIAAELYGGWDDPRTIDIRRWIGERPGITWKLIRAVYTMHGERVAQSIRMHSWLRKPFRALFDCALRKARA